MISSILLTKFVVAFLIDLNTFPGWGRIEENGAQTDVLLETDVYLKTQKECKRMANAIKYDERAMICAYDRYTDACQVGFLK